MVVQVSGTGCVFFSSRVYLYKARIVLKPWYLDAVSRITVLYFSSPEWDILVLISDASSIELGEN